MSIKWQKCEAEHMRNSGIATKVNAYVVKLAVHLEVWEQCSSKKII